MAAVYEEVPIHLKCILSEVSCRYLQAISYDGTQASVTPRTCKENQTPAEIPIASDGAPIGSTITMVENGGAF